MLTELKLRKLRAKNHIGRENDERGLYCIFRGTGTHSWQYRYTSPITKREKVFTIGNYPKITLAQARAEHRLLYNDVKSGNCPQTQKVELRNVKPKVSVDFKDIAEDWLAMNKRRVSEVTWKKDWSRLENYWFPKFANKKPDEIRPTEILEHIRKLIDSIGRETGSRTLNVVKRVYDYAKVTGKVMFNNAEGLVKYIDPPNIQNRKAFETPEELGKFMHIVNNASDSLDLTGCALRLMPHIFCRHGEMLSMKWSDINWKKRTWKYEVKKKGVNTQIVFLSDETLEILNQIRNLTGDKENVFHSFGKYKQLTQRAVNDRKEILGYGGDTLNVHGFRTHARTFGEEVLKIEEKILEMCIAHTIPDPNNRAYARANRLDDRRDFYFAWSKYLVQLEKEHRKKSIKRVK